MASEKRSREPEVEIWAWPRSETGPKTVEKGDLAHPPAAAQADAAADATAGKKKKKKKKKDGETEAPEPAPEPSASEDEKKAPAPEPSTSEAKDKAPPTPETHTILKRLSVGVSASDTFRTKNTCFSH